MQECMWIKQYKNNSYFNSELQKKVKNLMKYLNISEMNNIRISPYFLNKHKDLIK